MPPCPSMQTRSSRNVPSIHVVSEFVVVVVVYRRGLSVGDSVWFVVDHCLFGSPFMTEPEGGSVGVGDGRTSCGLKYAKGSLAAGHGDARIVSVCWL